MKTIFSFFCIGVLCSLMVGCQTTPPPPQVVWKLPANLGKAKSEIGIKMYGPVNTNGGALQPGLAQQFIEAVQSKMIQSKRFHVTLPNEFGELKDAGDTDVVIKPFIDIIEQPMREDGREAVCSICKVMLDVKILDKEDGQAKDAINLDGVWKVVVPSVFGKPARPIDQKGLVVKAYEEAYKLLEKELTRNFPPAANVVGKPRVIPMPLPADWREGDPRPLPMVKVTTHGGANVGFKPHWRYLLFAMVEGAPVIIATLEADSIMEEKASFKTREINLGDPEAADCWRRLTGKEELKLLVTLYDN